MSFHRSHPALVVAGRTGEEPPEMAVVADSRVAGMKSCRSCPATYLFVVAFVAVVCLVADVSCGW